MNIQHEPDTSNKQKTKTIHINMEMNRKININDEMIQLEMKYKEQDI